MKVFRDAYRFNDPKITMMSYLLKLCLLENHYDRSDNDFWRLRLVNVFLLLTLAVFLFFLVFNLTATGLYANAALDLFGLLFVLFILYTHKKTNNLEITATLVLINVALSSLAIIYVAEKDYGIVMWSIFFPVFALFLKGKKTGLAYSLAYYIILLGYLFSVTDIDISMHYFVEIVAVLTILLAVIYYYEYSRFAAYTLLKAASIEDPLTGLYNRRHFNRVFEQEINRCRRSNSPFAFFIMDIDNFKQYNDFYGHIMGDETLQRVSQIIKDSMRRGSDHAFRLGGEEFGGILTGTGSEDYSSLVEKMRCAIESLAMPHEPNVPHGIVTASFGTTTVTDLVTVEPMTVYKLADNALYSAKEQGRNRTVQIPYSPAVSDRS